MAFDSIDEALFDLDFQTAAPTVSAPTEEYDGGYYEMRYIVTYLVMFLVSTLYLCYKLYQKYKKEPENDQQLETTTTNIQIPDGNAVARPTGKTVKNQTTGNDVTTGDYSASNSVSTTGNFPKSYAQTHDDAPKKTSRFFSPVKK